MKYCAVLKNGVFWLGVLLVVHGVWTFGESFDLGPGLHHFTIPGEIVLPFGIIFIILSLVMTCAEKRIDADEENIS